MNDMTFAERLKTARQDRGITTQKQLAERTGLKQQAISALETGTVKPSLETLITIAKELNTTTDYLLGLSDVQTAENVFRTFKDVVEALEKILDVFGENFKMHRSEYTTFGECVGGQDIPLTVKIDGISYTNPEQQNELEKVIEQIGEEPRYYTWKRIFFEFCEDDILTGFFERRAKMTALLVEKVIDRDTFDTWLSGEYNKLAKIALPNPEEV